MSTIPERQLPKAEKWPAWLYKQTEKPAEFIISPKFYEQNTDECIEKLKHFGFTGPLEALTPEGLDEDVYYAFAKTRLFKNAMRVEPNGETPKQPTLGEITIPTAVIKNIKHTSVMGISLNMGYGHERAKRYFKHLIEVLGGEWNDVFMGGPTDDIPVVFTDPNSILRTTLQYYYSESVKNGIRMGMIDPDVQTPPITNTMDLKIINTVLGLIKPETKTNPAAISQVFAGTDTDTKKDVDTEASLLYMAFGPHIKSLAKQWLNVTPHRRHIVISTFPMVSHVLTKLPNRLQSRIDAMGNFCTDAVTQLNYYQFGNMPTFIESEEGRTKFATRAREHPKNTYVVDGFPAPLSVFQKDTLAQKRRERLSNGEPLTIVALASGIAPAQIRSFEQLLREARDQVRQGKLRIVIQCGAEEGGGKIVYDKLSKTAKELGITDDIVLHVAKHPDAALDFFEMLSWSDKPMALYVKGSEMARVGYALNIPLIPTGAIGDHEIWNLALSMKQTPEYIHFLPRVANTLKREMGLTWKDDEEVKNTPGLFDDTIKRIDEATVPDFDALIHRVKEYIGSTTTSKTNKAAMLDVLHNLISRAVLAPGRHTIEYESLLP